MSQLPPIRTKRVTTHRTREGAQYWRRLLLGKGSVQATLPDSGSSSTQCQATCTSITAPASAAGQEICLSPLSQFFLNVENPPDIYAIMTLDGYCRLEELVQPMQHMADLHDRFRRRVVYRFGAWTAEMLEEFDVTTRMKEVTLDGCDAEQAFHDYMGQLMTHVPLGMDGFPPWDVWCIHYTSHPTRTDVLMRASHIIGDGQLFMKIIKQIMEPQDTTAAADYATTVLADTAAPGSSRSRCKETEAVSEPGEVDTEVRRSLSSDSSCSCSSGAYGSDSEASGGAYRADSSSSGSSSCGDLDSSNSIEIDDEQLQQQQVLRRKAAADCVVHLKPSIMQDSAKLEQQEGPQQQQQPQQQEQQGCQLPLQLQQQQQLQLRRRQRGIWQRVAQSLHVICRLLVMCWRGYTALIFTAILPFWFADPVTVVKASAEQCTGPRRWSSETIGLSDFYRTAKLLGHSINTLAVTCSAGGIRRYILRHGCRPARRVRLCSMVDTRSMPGLLTGTDGNSNNFSFIGVPLYTGDCSALERVTRVGAALSWIRHSLAVPLAIRMPSILQFIFRSPVWSTWAVLFCLPWKTTIGFSNMRGPAGRWSLSGHPVVRIHNGVQPMAFGCFVSLFSYGDTLTFTHTCYSTKTDKPQLLLTCLLEEYDSLRKAAALNVTIDSRQDTDPGSPGGRIKAA